MRTPTWERSPGALVEFLNSRKPMKKADVWTIRLKNGVEFKWSSGDIALTVGPNTFEMGPSIERSKVRFTTGLEVDSMTVRLWDSRNTMISGVPLQAFILSGGFESAYVKLERAFWGEDDVSPIGTVMWFVGTVDDVSGDGYEAKIRVVSLLKWLNVQVPREVYQGPCLNTVYDPSTCGVSRASKVVTGTAQSDTNSYRTKFDHNLANPIRYFELGSIKMITGLNAGISRTVKLFGPESITVLRPWPFVVSSGDQYEIVPGCDGTYATCGSKFSNTGRFRGQPLIPVAETVL
jgi:uncharacterized phage protein (TIGR02218 family)